MTTFSDVKQRWEDFQKLLKDNIPDVKLFEPISIEEPTSPEDELHFVKLVAWTYVLFVESFPVLYRQISGVLRNSDIVQYKRINEVHANVHALRTVQGHNLKVTSSGDQKKITVATIWKNKYGGSPFNWTTCCTALCGQIVDVLKVLHGTIQESLNDEGDFKQFKEELCFSIERTWEAHSFDEIIESVANAIGIRGLDVKKYRAGRIKEWQDAVSLFNTKADAEQAMLRLIKTELKSKFGGVQKKPKKQIIEKA